MARQRPERRRGGVAIGVWAADNAQLFFPTSTGAESLLPTLLTVQDEIGRACRTRIGIGVHLGDYYRLGDGLHGPQADAIEDVAEHDTEGGQIAVSTATCGPPPGSTPSPTPRRSTTTCWSSSAARTTPSSAVGWPRSI